MEFRLSGLGLLPMWVWDRLRMETVQPLWALSSQRKFSLHIQSDWSLSQFITTVLCFPAINFYKEHAFPSQEPPGIYWGRAPVRFSCSLSCPGWASPYSSAFPHKSDYSSPDHASSFPFNLPQFIDSSLTPKGIPKLETVLSMWHKKYRVNGIVTCLDLLVVLVFIQAHHCQGPPALLSSTSVPSLYHLWY